MVLGQVLQAAVLVWGFQILLAIYKVFGVITLDWWLVLAPLWSPTALALVAASLILLSPWRPQLR